MTGTHFYVNTFDVDAYARALPDRRPIALALPVDRELEMAYWLYWRVYELEIGEGDFSSCFGERTLAGRYGHLLEPLRLLGLVERSPGGYRVTRAGAYWVHRLQNEYSLDYINRLWGRCRRQAWPSSAVL